MSELAYPVDHPAHPDNKGKKFGPARTAMSHDYPANHPARGGQGQSVALAAGSEHPRDGQKHLHGLEGDSLTERQKSFAALSPNERAERLKWNEEGIPVEPEKEG